MNSSQWQFIKGYENLYKINVNGQVLSLPKKFIDRWGNIRETKQRILTPVFRRKYGGRYVYGLTDSQGKLKQHYQHILVAETFQREVSFTSFVDEKWKKVQSTKYEISNYGRIRLKRRNYDIKRMTFCEYKLEKGSDNGHGYISFRNPRKYIHRLVAEAFLPNPDNLPEVDHKNGIRSDNRASNLEWVSRVENQRRMVKRTMAKKES